MVTLILYGLYGAFMFLFGYVIGWIVGGGDKHVPKS